MKNLYRNFNIPFQKVGNIRRLKRFDSSAWNDLTYGNLRLNFLNIIHGNFFRYFDLNGYQRYRYKFRHQLIDDKKLYLNVLTFNENDEVSIDPNISSDEKQRIAQFIGVGVSMFAFDRLLKDEMFLPRVIPETSSNQTPDFIHESLGDKPITIECKGRQNITPSFITQTCNNQLNNYKKPKYVIGINTSGTLKGLIGDPPREDSFSGIRRTYASLLHHYSTIFLNLGYLDVHLSLQNVITFINDHKNEVTLTANLKKYSFWEEFELPSEVNFLNKEVSLSFTLDKKISSALTKLDLERLLETRVPLETQNEAESRFSDGTSISIDVSNSYRLINEK